MGFIVCLSNNRFVKRTSRFGCFYGSVVLTTNIKEARVWTKESNAKGAVNSLLYRHAHYPWETKKIGSNPNPVVKSEEK